MFNKEEFDNAVVKSKTLSKRPSNDILLKFYGLYKQVTESDIKGDRPGGFDFKGAAKYDAWKKQEGKSKKDAAKEYIDLVNSLLDQ